jgi:2-keto-4-pentenoate hydratase/2-oxohepta-3-ene-1,7-dioic acid hydratase in catechol pathway
MRLVTFENNGPQLGVWDSDLIIEPAEVLRADLERRRGQNASDHSPQLPRDMVEFFETGEEGLEMARRAVAAARKAEIDGDRLPGVHSAEDTQLLAPVPRPRRMRDYLTYTAHAEGSGLDVPPAFAAMPICYQGNTETVIGPDQPLVWPSYTNQLDFELEFGFFTRSHGRDLTVKEAQSAIAGITIFNDVSARDIQLFEMSLTVGPSKGKHFCTAMGPSVVTMDEVDEWGIDLEARVNGEVWATGTTANRQFSCAEVLAWASLDEDVYPGEFLALGTVGGGCGFELDRWIREHDVVELSASGVGTLRNPVGAKNIAAPGSGLASYQGAAEVHV